MSMIVKVAATIVKLEPHKKHEYDRGTKKVLVNGEHWGWIETQFHGSQGTSFHLSDLHGKLTRPLPLPNQPHHRIDVKVHSPNKRHLRIDNIGKANPKPIPTSDFVMLKMIDEAIQNGWLRSPETRAAEIQAARDTSAKASAAHRQKEQAIWNKKIDQIMDLGLNLSPDSRGTMLRFETEQLRQAISDAMKWAQTQ